MAHAIYIRGRRTDIIHLGPITTSATEIGQLFKAWLAISLAFAIVLGGFSLTTKFLQVMVIAAFTVGIGFLLHELAHKLVAQAYGAWAEFRSFDQMLLLAIIMSFFGFVFAAPGAVFIHGHIDMRKNWIISAAGPWTNIGIAILFAISGLIFSLPAIFIAYGFMINAWLAAFNMIPFGNFDGRKVWAWSKLAYIITLLISIFLVMASQMFTLL